MNEVRELVTYKLCDVCHREIDKIYYIEKDGEKLKVCEECSEKGAEI